MLVKKKLACTDSFLQFSKIWFTGKVNKESLSLVQIKQIYTFITKNQFPKALRQLESIPSWSISCCSKPVTLVQIDRYLLGLNAIKKNKFTFTIDNKFINLYRLSTASPTINFKYPLQKLTNGDFGISYTCMKKNKVRIKKELPVYQLEPGFAGKMVILKSHNKDSPLKEIEISQYLQDKCKEILSYAMLPYLLDPNFSFVLTDFQGRDLFFYLDEQLITSNLIVSFYNMIVKVLPILHDQDIYHLDIKPENIVVIPVDIDTNGHIRYVLKLLDFEGAKVANFNQTFDRTKEYMSPEYKLRHKKSWHKEYDLFSSLIVFFELLGIIQDPSSLQSILEKKINQKKLSCDQSRLLEDKSIKRYIAREVQFMTLLSFVDLDSFEEIKLKDKIAAFRKHFFLNLLDSGAEVGEKQLEIGESLENSKPIQRNTSNSKVIITEL